MSPQQKAILAELEHASDWVEGPALMRSAGVGSYGALKVQIRNLRNAGARIESRRGKPGGYRLAEVA